MQGERQKQAGLPVRDQGRQDVTLRMMVYYWLAEYHKKVFDSKGNCQQAISEEETLQCGMVKKVEGVCGKRGGSLYKDVSKYDSIKA